MTCEVSVKAQAKIKRQNSYKFRRLKALAHHTSELCRACTALLGSKFLDHLYIMTCHADDSTCFTSCY